MVEEYPQLGITEAQLPEDEGGDWVYDQDKNAVAYAQRENGIMYLYGDAGDLLWKSLCELDILPKADHESPQSYRYRNLLKFDAGGRKTTA